jgi:hypothetical protein
MVPVFRGLGLLAALSKSKAASMALLLDSRSVSAEYGPSIFGSEASNPNKDSSFTWS